MNLSQCKDPVSHMCPAGSDKHFVTEFGKTFSKNSNIWQNFCRKLHENERNPPFDLFRFASFRNSGRTQSGWLTSCALSDRQM